MTSAPARSESLDFASPGSAEDRFRVGTLQYTRRSLVGMFLWILWGDFAITTMAFITPSILPLMLKEVGAANQSIALICMTIPNVLSLLIQPIISVKSDRLRSRWGRRIPLILLGTPCLTACILLLGFSNPISRGVHHLLGGSISFTTVALGTLGVFVVLTQFFNILVSTAYYTLINDVVPPAFLSRFFALFSIVSRAANFFFLWFILGNALTHTREIFTGIAILYFVCFMLIALRVKEGRYPPPPAPSPTRWGSVTRYFRESFSSRYYVAFFLSLTFYNVASLSFMFQIFFAESIGISNANFGKIAAWTGLPVLALMYPAGILANRIHPIRAMFVCLFGYCLLHLLFLFTVRGEISFIVIASSAVFVTALINVTLGPLQMLIFPRDRYAQFASAYGLLTAGATIVFSYGVGLCMDLVNNYRFIFVWSIVFQLLSAGFLYIVYRHWRVHGDTRDEVAPGVSATDAPTESPKVV